MAEELIQLAEPVRNRRFGLTQFDLIVMTIIAILVAAIVVTVALGDFSQPGPRIAYLGPADGPVHNIWIADPTQPGSAEQVTFSSEGIYNFGVSPDGRYIAFSERNNSTGTTEIKLLDLRTGALRQLTNCIADDADCKTPTWSPDGKMIAYERTEQNTALTGAGVGPIRVWLIDLSANPTSTRPLFNDSQILGYSPQWSGDGSRIAVFDSANAGILIYNFLDGTSSFIPSRYGDVGTLSPDGARLVFPEMTLQGSQLFAHLRIANLAKQQFSELTLPNDPVDDIMPAWNPDGTRLAVARQYLDSRWTRGHQVYLLNTQDGSVEPLVVDEKYNSSFFQWDPSGENLLMQRLPVSEDGMGGPEVWTYNLSTDTLVQVAVNAFSPRWVP